MLSYLRTSAFNITELVAFTSLKLLNKLWSGTLNVVDIKIVPYELGWLRLNVLHFCELVNWVKRVRRLASRHKAVPFGPRAVDVLVGEVVLRLLKPNVKLPGLRAVNIIVRVHKFRPVDLLSRPNPGSGACKGNYKS